MNLYEDDYPTWVNRLFDEVCRKGICYDSQLDEVVWATTRQFKEIPHIGNIMCDTILKRIIDGFKNRYEDDYDLSSFETYINGLDSHLSLNGEYITEYQDLIDNLEGLEYERKEN